MRARIVWIALGVAAIAMLLALGIPRVRVIANRRDVRDLIDLQKRRAVLRDSLTQALAREPLLEFAEKDTSSIAVALSEQLMVTMLQQFATRYLDRVTLDLRDLSGHGQGKVETPTPLGRMKVGNWSVQVAAHQITGVLTAETPVVDVTGTNHVHVALPIRVQGGEGNVTLTFKWDSRAIFNVVCRDFETVQTIHGSILPQRHVVRGDLVLSAGSHGIVADPDFPSEKFPLSMALSDESYRRLRSALEEQDKLFKCGLMIQPDTVMARLRTLGVQGLRFRIPRTAFRRIYLPATIERSVRILDSSVQLSVKPSGLRIAPGILWYGASIEARRAPSDTLLPWPAEQP